jgi:acyl-CoA thioester hydrolase
MFASETQVRVRYAETDQMGYVYYGNYPMYYEVARVEAFRKLGFPYKNLEEMGIGMPVLDMNIKYHSPGKYDELLTLKVKLLEMPTARIKFLYEIFNETGKMINEGSTTLVFMKMENGRPVRLPQIMHDLLIPFFSEKD